VRFRSFLLLTAPAWAHVVSMSTGELRIDGPLAEYELRIPMSEVAQMANRELILDYIHFDGGHRTKSSCAEEAESGSYVCKASYEFATLVPERLGVYCTFYEATVPNHVHWLTATRGTKSDQEVFDRAFPRAELQFRSPSRFENLGRAFASGFLRAATNWIGLLFLLGLAIAAPRSALPILGFLAGEAAAIFLGPRIPWPLPPRFLEAAMALTVAYLAVEILMAADQRNLVWIAAVLGLPHGLSIAGFPAPYIAGAGLFEIAAFIALALAARLLAPGWRKGSAWGLLAAGLAFFAVRVIVR
jgi:hypothetical protein